MLQRRVAGSKISKARESDVDQESLLAIEDKTSKYHHPGPLHCRRAARRFLCLIAGVLALVCGVGTSLLLTKSLVFPILNLECSLLLHRYATWRRGDSCHWNYRECSFDLCAVVHEGGEGWLYDGTCLLADPSDHPVATEVMLKSYKISNLKPAYTETGATKALSSLSNSTVRVFYDGFNYLVVKKLVGYEPVGSRNIILERTLRDCNPDDNLQGLIVDYMSQVHSQVKGLHQAGYFHLDLSFGNVLRRTNTTEFQLIDLSSARPTSEWKRLIKDSLQRYRRSHLPQLPLLVCLLPQRSLSSEQQTYCGEHESEVTSVCSRFLDDYVLGVQVLRWWHFLAFKNHLPWIGATSFDNILKQHELHIQAFQKLQAMHHDTTSNDSINLLSQLLGMGDGHSVCVDSR